MRIVETEVSMMQVVKKINNNVAICIDRHGRELIAFGKGIGFPSIPYELTDLSLIQRTFYDVSSQYMEMVNTLPGEVVEFSAEVVGEARTTLDYLLTPNLLLTLADHIAFAIQRTRQGIYIKMPLAYDLEQMYPQEVELARKTVERIRKRFQVALPWDEVSGIAMAFINARVSREAAQKEQSQRDNQRILEDITRIIQQQMNVTIDRSSFNFARYATHVQYLLDRLRSGQGIDSVNSDIYVDLRQEFEKAAACVDQIVNYLQQRHHFTVTEEEQLYLILHVNRVCANEGL